MAFDFKTFARHTGTALFRSRGTSFSLTPRRIGLLLAFYTLFLPLELLHWIGFLLDDIFFSEYQRVEIAQPVFIVGFPRSGTTFLHRLMAKDRQSFSTMKMWEIVLAPSVVQRKAVRALTTLDRRLGSPLERLLTAWDEHWHVGNVMHKVAWQEPEEVQFLLLHIWSTLTVATFSAIVEEAAPYIHFDTQMPPAEKERIMDFYTRSIQRHLYSHTDDRNQPPAHYLCKNPSASPKIGTLYERYPNAKIIYLIRNPLDAIPSYVSLMNHTWRLFGASAKDHESRDYVLEIANHWYRYPLERLAHAPADSYCVVRYDDLVRDPEQTIADIYSRFGFEIGPAFAQVLQKEASKARSYRSKHSYSLAQAGLSRQQIVTEFEDIFARFEFDTRESPRRAGSRTRWQMRPIRRRMHRLSRIRSRQRQRIGPAKSRQ